MAPPGVVVHSSPLDLLRAISGQPDADSVRTNLCLGFVFARWLKEFTSPAPSPDKAPDTQDKPDEQAEVLVTAWESHQLRLIFIKLGWMQCKIVSPVAPDQLESLALPLVPTLMQHVLQLAPFVTDPALLRSICGPQPLVDTFLRSWPHARRVKPSLVIIPASIRTVPAPVDLPSGHSFSRISDVYHLPLSELSAIGHLLVAFYGDYPTAPRFSPDDLLQHTRAMILRGAFWVYRAPSSVTPNAQDHAHSVVPVGFVQTGRPTPRTCAIRMVFVAPSHRGAGIAQRMVSAVARAHLYEAPRLTFDLSSDGPKPIQAVEEKTTRFGGKDEVCLFVEPANEGARRAYAKVGFVEERGDVWCEAVLEGIEPGHW